MSRKGWVAAFAVALITFAAPAAAQWQYDARNDIVYYGSVPVGQWYGERPSMHPPVIHAPAQRRPCPNRMCGYPLPIYRAPTGVPVEGRPVARVAAGDAHAAWCARRYRSYDWRSDTWQPTHGPRRACHSPWR